MIPLPKIEDIVQAFKKAQQIYASHGITMAQEGVITKELAEIYKFLTSKNEIFLDIVAYMENKDVEKIEREYKDYFNQYKDNLKIGGIKIFLDGSPQAKTAWLRDEYENDEKYYGYKILKDEDIEQVLKKEKEKN